MLESAFSAAPTSQISDRWSDHSKGTTWIYFINVNNEQRIKIGRSTQGRGQRRKQHENTLVGKIPLEYLCEVRGTASDETAVQRYFSKYAIDGSKELFEPAQEIIEYIRWLRDQWFVVLPEATNKEREDMPVVASSEWLPNDVRRKPKTQGLLPGINGPFDLGVHETTADDFYTNPIIIEAARSVMGSIDLDPASHVTANRTVRARRFFSRSENGLLQTWQGNVWLNPPFSTWSEWASKVTGEWKSGNVSAMCVLAATRTLTAQYFAPVLASCDASCIFRGRIKFLGHLATTPDDGHAVFYFGKDREAFKRHFSELGQVFYKP